MENEISMELAEKLSQAKSAEEILAIAGQNGLQISPEEANLAIEDMKNQGELTDDELAQAAGGKNQYGLLMICKHCGRAFRIRSVSQLCPRCHQDPYK